MPTYILGPAIHPLTILLIVNQMISIPYMDMVRVCRATRLQFWIFIQCLAERPEGRPTKCLAGHPAGGAVRCMSGSLSGGWEDSRAVPSVAANR